MKTVSNLDLGIDLGTANIIISANGKGAVFNEPSVIAYNKRTEEVVAFGEQAYKMIGRSPEHIAVIRPLKDGVISNNDMAQELIRLSILKVIGKRLVNPGIVMCVPSCITAVERKAVVESAVSAGARTVYLIEEPVAALIGAGADILKPVGQMVVDVGGGTVDVAVTSLGGVVVSKSLKKAGNSFDASIERYFSEHFKLLVGERTAEDIKIKYANVFWPSVENVGVAVGRSLITGLPDKCEFSEADICKAIIDDVDGIVGVIKEAFEQTPPELIGDIYDNGILFTGGGAMLKGLDLYVTRELGVKCFVASDPLCCVARGTYKAFRIKDKLRNGFERISVFKR